MGLAWFDYSFAEGPILLWSPMGSQHCCRSMAPANVRVWPPTPTASAQVLGVLTTQLLLPQSCSSIRQMHKFLLVGIHQTKPQADEQVRTSGGHQWVTALISALLQTPPSCFPEEAGWSHSSSAWSPGVWSPLPQGRPSSILHPPCFLLPMQKGKSALPSYYQAYLAVERYHQKSPSASTAPKSGYCSRYAPPFTIVFVL